MIGMTEKMAEPSRATTLVRDTRARLIMQRALKWLVWGLAVGGFTYGASVMFDGTAVVAVVMSIAFALMVVVLGALWNNKRSPLTPSSVAKIIDSRADLRERISTSLEVPATAGVIARALHRDAHAKASGIDAAAIAPWRLPVIAATALLMGAGFALVSSITSGETDLTTRSESISAPADTRVDVERVLDLAELAEAAAEDRDDPLLGALSLALRDLARETLDSGASAVADDETLQDLLGTLATAIGSEDALRHMGAVDREATASTEATPSLSEAMSILEERLAPPTIPGPNDPDFFDVELARLPGDRRDSSEGPASTVERPEGPVEANYLSQQVRDDLAARTTSESVSEIGAAEIIGASQDASAGQSQLAGQGSQQLDGQTSETVRPETSQLVAVEGRERDEGRRIELDLTPRQGWQDEAAGGFEVGPWLSGDEARVTAQVIPFAYRTAAGRFFAPSQTLREQLDSQDR